MLSTLLLCLCFAGPPEEGALIELDSIAVAFAGDFLPLGEPDGRREAFLLFKSGDSLLVPFDAVSLEQEGLRLSTEDGEGDHVRLTAEWVDEGGNTHTVVTDCGRYTMTKCVKVHTNAVLTLQSAFPPKVEH